MKKNSIKGHFLLLFLALSNANAALYRKNEKIERANNNLSQRLQKHPQISAERKITDKNPSKSRQRMSAAKIAGIVIAVLLGAAVVGALLGGVIFPL